MNSHYVGEASLYTETKIEAIKEASDGFSKNNFFGRLEILKMKGKLQTGKIKHMAYKALILIFKELL